MIFYIKKQYMKRLNASKKNSLRKNNTLLHPSESIAIDILILKGSIFATNLTRFNINYLSR